MKHLPLIPLPRKASASEGTMYLAPETPVRLVRAWFHPREWYRLQTGDQGLVVAASHPHGWLRGLATLATLLPPAPASLPEYPAGESLVSDTGGNVSLEDVQRFFQPRHVSGLWQNPPGPDDPWGPCAWPCSIAPMQKDTAREPLMAVPHLQIEDVPAFGWRGLMFDSARHFYAVPFILRLLDHMARLRLNVFHWHLSDDQGFRIAIPGFPRLHEYAACRSTGHGGYYSDADIALVLRHAAARGIQVIPEVDIPGHVGAILAAYPSLGCRGKPMDVPLDWGVLDHFLCPGQEGTFAFVRALVTRLSRLFPDTPLHLGGDEVRSLEVWEQCPHCKARRQQEGLADARALEGYFWKRTLAIAKELGVTPIVWDDCAPHLPAAGAQKRPPVQFWLNPDHARSASDKGYPLINSHCAHCYLDMNYHDPQPRMWAGHIDTAKAFALEVDKECSLGMEAALWTEFCPGPADAEWHLYPRLYALAERAWNPSTTWEDFRQRLRASGPWLQAAGIRYYPDPAVWKD